MACRTASPVPRISGWTAVRAVGGDRVQVLGDLLPLVSDDHDHVVDAGTVQGAQDVPEQRFPRDLVQHLGLGRLHPGPETRGQNDGYWMVHTASLVPGGGPGRHFDRATACPTKCDSQFSQAGFLSLKVRVDVN